MSKVICDVCGTAYPETATTCPICGSAKQVSEQTAAGNVPEEEQGAAYAYVKGGRFSKRNVRRRNSRGGAAEVRVPATERKSRISEDMGGNAPENNEGGEEESVNKGLVAVVIVLLLAIIAVLVYIGIRFLAPDNGVQAPTAPPTLNVDPTPTGDPDPTEPPTDATVSCTGLTLSQDKLAFTEIGGSFTLSVTVAPVDTTDVLTFKSADETVATVTENGVVKAVGYGVTTITVSCGDITETVEVTCISNFTIEFNTNPKWNDPVTGYPDTTVTQGETWKAYKGTLSVPVDQITWTSDDPTIATVQNGIVTAISPGKTYIYAEYGGKRFTCIFRCKAAAGAGDNVDTSNPSDVAFSFRWATLDAATGKYDTTMTAGVGSTWTAYATGIDPANVAWSVKDETIISVSAEGVVTALAVGNTELYAVYDGVTFTCIVRVPNT